MLRFGCMDTSVEPKNSFSQISKVTGVPTSTISNIIKYYKERGGIIGLNTFTSGRKLKNQSAETISQNAY